MKNHLPSYLQPLFPLHQLSFGGGGGGSVSAASAPPPAPPPPAPPAPARATTTARTLISNITPRRGYGSTILSSKRGPSIGDGGGSNILGTPIF